MVGVLHFVFLGCLSVFFLLALEQTLYLHIFVRVVLGRINCQFLKRIFKDFAVESVSSACRRHLFLKLGEVGNMCGVYRLILLVLSVEPEFLLISMHGGAAVIL